VSASDKWRNLRSISFDTLISVCLWADLPKARIVLTDVFITDVLKFVFDSSKVITCFWLTLERFRFWRWSWSSINSSVIINGYLETTTTPHPVPAFTTYGQVYKSDIRYPLANYCFDKGDDFILTTFWNRNKLAMSSQGSSLNSFLGTYLVKALASKSFLWTVFVRFCPYLLIFVL
jgi:hypothetical protein